MGVRGLGQGERRGQADLPQHRLLLVPLVPRHGAGVVRRRADRRLPQRALRKHQGRSGGAARPRRHLHGRRAGAHRAAGAGRSASGSTPDWGAVLRRHLLPPGRSTGHALFPPGPRSHRPGMERPARRPPQHRGDGARTPAAGGRSSPGIRPRARLPPGRAGASTGDRSLPRPRRNSSTSADRVHGGWGGAPKFPQPLVLEYPARSAGHRTST